MATVNLGQVRDKITAITKTGTTGGTAPTDIYTIYTECSPGGVGTFQVKNGASNFVDVGASNQFQGINEFCDLVESVGGPMGPSASANCIFYAYDSDHHETFIAFGGFISGSTCTIVGYDVTKGHPFRALRPYQGTFSHVYTDVDTYAYIDQTNYNDLDVMCNNAFAYLNQAYESVADNRWKRYIAHKGSQVNPTSVYTFVSFAGNTDPDYPIVKKLYGYSEKGGFFCAVYSVTDDTWYWHNNTPEKLGPFTSASNLKIALLDLENSGFQFNILSASVIAQTTTGGGDTITTTYPAFVYFEHSADSPSSSAVLVFYLNSSGVMTAWNDTPGKLYLMVDTEETYNPA